MYVNKAAAAAILGSAPRAIVCAACVRATESILGKHLGARKCPRCKRGVSQSVVVSAPTLQRGKAPQPPEAA